MPDSKTYLFDLPARGRPEPLTIPEVFYPNVRSFWASSTSSRIFDPILGIKAVVIHATAGGSSAGTMSMMQAGTASFHWLVPDENESQHGHVVWACAPEARAAWHVRNDKGHPLVNGGAMRVNHWSLGIEVVNTQVANPFSDWQVEATARIVRYCWAKYPNLETIVSHAAFDPHRRTDPEIFDWARFRQLVVSPAGTESVSSMIAGVTPMGKLAPADLQTCCVG
jgi:N-acetyl-anhydromuramyl-L-alanine amidase AmpD